MIKSLMLATACTYLNLNPAADANFEQRWNAMTVTAYSAEDVCARVTVEPSRDDALAPFVETDAQIAQSWRPTAPKNPLDAFALDYIPLPRSRPPEAPE